MSEEVASVLLQYVENGGNLISEACPGRIDEHAYCRRGELSPTMGELFGVRHESLTMVREPEGGSRWSPAERSWGEYLDAAMLEGSGVLQGHRLRANVYIETFSPVESEPILYCGDAVVGTMRQAGKGQAWLLGTFAGHNGTAYRDRDSRAFVRALLAQCGARPSHPGRLLLRKRSTGEKEAWFFTNGTDQEATERVAVSGWSHAADLLGVPVERDDGQVTVTVPSLDVRVLVLQGPAA